MFDWMHVRLLLMLVAIGLFVVAMVLVEQWTRHREHGDRIVETAAQAGGALPSQPCASCESFDRGSKSAQRPEQEPVYKRAA
jgi:hypothetical protein